MSSPGHGSWRTKSVKFNPNIIETSFGGSQKFCPIKINHSNSSFSDSPSSEDSSLPEMERTFFDLNSPKDQSSKRRVRSYPNAIFNQVPNQEIENSYKIMKAALSKHSDLVKAEEDSCGIIVAVRVRPFTKREILEADVRCVVSMLGDETSIIGENIQKLKFTFDHSFWSFNHQSLNYADQQFCYETVARPLLCKAFEGYNTCLFAYGQTGSGKSYSVMGSDEEPGIIPRFSEELFQRISNIDSCFTVNVEISFFEIYNEKIHDLLTSGDDGKLSKRLNLKVREHPVTGPYVEGLSLHPITCYKDLEMWLSLGNKQRATASTGMNEKSSRSHSVFTILLSQTKTERIEGEIHEHSITSKINLIDLAGSERQSTAKTTGDRLKEGASINKSLLTLGKVISQLSDMEVSVDTKKRKVYIPYRDSVLTWLLKESLGGNSKTAMLATISPANICLEETVSTLRYASQARYIVNVARVNEDPKARLIRTLRSEIENLRGMMTGSLTDDATHAAGIAEIANLKSQLTDKERAMRQMTISWEERLKASEEKMKEETKFLEKSGIALKINQKLPYLVNLNEDPQLSETLVYVLQEGSVKVGQSSEIATKIDIQLGGALIATEHCMFHNDKDTVCIEPILDALTYVNGDQIVDITELNHGDRVILGGDHYFRYHHSKQPVRSRSDSGNSVKDFQFAREELIQVQNAKMEAELAEIRRKTQEEMEKQKAELEEEAKLKLAATKKEADQKLCLQKQEYEGKLKELSEKLEDKDFESTISEEVKKQADHLEKENVYLKNQVDGYTKHINDEVNTILTDYSPTNGTSDVLEEIEAIKRQMNDEVLRLTDLRNSTRKSALTPGRRQTPGVLRNNRVVRDASPELPRNVSETTNLASNHCNLYDLALLIREANKIAEFLGKDTDFSREIIDDRTYCIRVNKPLMGISTFWSVEKLQNQLLRMREMYEGNVDANDSADPFYDGGDTWEQNDRINSPAFLHKRLKAIRLSLSPRMVIKRLSFNDDLCSPVFSLKHTPPCNLDKREGNTSNFTIGLCEKLVQQLQTRISLREEMTLTDLVLLDLQELQTLITVILTSENDSETVAELCLTLTVGFQNLLEHHRCWLMQPLHLSQSLISVFSDQHEDLLRKFSDQLALLLQGSQAEISSMIHQSGSKCQQILYQIAKLNGEFSLASQCHVSACFEMSEDKLSKGLKTAFLSGSDLFVDKTLKSAITDVEESEFKLQTTRDDQNTVYNLITVHEQSEVLVTSVRILLMTIQETQVAIETISLNSELPSHYYSENYKRLMDLVIEVSSLSDQVRLLTQTSNELVSGIQQDVNNVQKCSDSIDRITGRLAMKCTPRLDFDDMDSCESDRIHTAAQEIRLCVQELAQTVRRVSV